MNLYGLIEYLTFIKQKLRDHWKPELRQKSGGTSLDIERLWLSEDRPFGG